MSTSDASTGALRRAGDETYLGLKGASVGQGARRAESHAAFFTPYLALGMRVLDCGCGPGSITCDLARIVAPGEVVGIDFNPKAVETATAFATEQGVVLITFQT
jgi:ubiquinone/menaquinone biosynthesis C-methylase UbiE